ncbi:hypothetical protein NIES4075_24720 [Tolypothrix sp. NIES-4075]|uniref:hypothetical protein n=1 Tax=Tolypothrix sp. NIES-4075 TaxID=2005459 RepID=UPI000B5CC2CA|nr:hypothetical protein [Tolypothrix sp. NIES-4075]GAX41499.1 hypothetical protein NIES4075_24720 [Tolypothrix sp. NIES-4075]
MSQRTLIFWIGIILFYIACNLVIAVFSGRPWQLGLTQFLRVIISAFGVVTGSSIIYKALTSQHLMRLLGDDTITLLVGASVVIWLSIEEILKP